jgi:hypothetical protein
MKTTTTALRIPLLFLLLGLLGVDAWGQYADPSSRRNGILNGNQVRTVFTNWGVIGYPPDGAKRGAWKDDNNGYIGDVSPLVGAEVRWNDTTFRAVIPCPVSFRPQAPPRPEDPITGLQWAFEPEPGYFGAPPNQSIAISNNPKSWPTEWPDKMTDLTDPGWKGSWNGYFGKRISADLETYFVMDDNNYKRWNYSANNSRKIAFHPDSRRAERDGLGMVMSVRGLQWAQFLAQDNIFWLYEITNTGTTSYDRVVFGMLVGTYVGVTSTEDVQEYSDDWSFYNPFYNITYTGDFDRSTSRNPRWNQKFPVGMVGYAFLESPGNPFDGIDNDGDADSSLTGRTAPKFDATSFDSTTIIPGMRLVMIQDDFSRSVITVPNVDAFRVKTRGMRDSIWIYPGKTRLAEGNVIRDAGGNSIVNPNAYDGIDNNFNGLIDENYYLHYRQVKRQPDPSKPPLFDILRPLRHVDYVAGTGTDPLSLIDERRDDRIDNDNDWSKNRPNGATVLDPSGKLIDDVGRDGIAETGDFGEGDGFPTSGYDALGNDTGLPGEPNIDKTDVNESDQIGLTSFFYFTPSGGVKLGDDEYLWKGLAPGYFDVPKSIVNGKPINGEDGDFFYGSGYFPLLAGKTERFSLALVYGGGKGGGVDDDINDLLKNKQTVQNIYDANYQFAVPPDKPVLTAVPGDHMVTLYWDRRAESSVDPILKTRDFEGYKIYKSTDPNFSDVFTITDGTGTPKGYSPLKQFDLVDSVKGYFRATGELFDAMAGYSIYLGDETGLQHSYVDKDVQNGRTYYYAVVAYDKGSDSLKLLPSENTKQVSVSETGEVSHDINVAMVMPNSKAAGYVAPANAVPLAKHAAGTGSVVYNTVDQTKVSAHHYLVTFLDTQVDGVDNNGNGLIDANDSTEWNRITTSYSVKDEFTYSEKFTGQDTLASHLSRINLDPATVVVKNSQGAVVPASSYYLDPAVGTIRSSTPGSLPAGQYTISYQYYPVYKSTNIQGTPYQKESKDSDIFDGVQLTFSNDWGTHQSNPDSGWSGSRQIRYDFVRTDLFSGQLQGIARPNDYEMQFSASIVDTSVASPDLPFLDTPIPVNFRLFDISDSAYAKFYFYDNDANARISYGDQLILLEKGPNGRYVPTWTMFFKDTSSNYNIGASERLRIKTKKPFRQGDVLDFTSVLPTIDSPQSVAQLDRIKVVPNPYLTASQFEPPLPPGITSGRGERKIEFIHLPVGAKIQIFTSRGDHVITLRDGANTEDGTISWNLKSKENLDVAFGIYFYVVESPAGNKTGKIAIIK